MKIEIKCRWDRPTIEVEADSLREAVLKCVAERRSLYAADLSGADLSGAVLRGAVLRGAVLRDADLSGADLSGADLSGAVLRGAVLRGADLRGAVLRGAVLRDADLSGAVLRGADLRGADLSGAVLRGAVLRGADLSGADLRGADLSGAVLRGADTGAIKEDFFEVLTQALPAEIPGLRAALVEGRVDGTAYEGECACLVGTIANLRFGKERVQVQALDLGDLRPNASRPAEKWFLAIREGDTPKNNPVSALTVQWLDEWVAKNGNPAPEVTA